MAWLQSGIDKTPRRLREARHADRPARASSPLLLVGGFIVGDRRRGLASCPRASCPRRTRAPSWPSCSCPMPPRPTARSRSLQQVEGMIDGKPWLQSLFTVSGYSLLDGLAQPNRALVVVALKPFAERKDRSLSVFAALRRAQQGLPADPGGQRLRLQPAADHGPGQFVGLRVPWSRAWPARSPAELAAVARGLMAAAQNVPELAGVFTTYGAATPQIYLKLDRERAQTLGIPISDIFSALQTAMGGNYANDFNLFGRTWQVKIQAEADDRKKVDRRLPRAPAHRGRRSRAPAGGGRRRADHRARLDHPLQQPALGDDATARRRRATRPARRSPPWRSSPSRPCRPATATNGPARPSRRRRRRARPASSSGWRWCSPISSWSASTRARRSRSPRCCR